MSTAIGASLPFSPVAGGVRITVRLTPKAAHDRVDGIADDANGEAILKVAVTAVPEKGKANAALIKMLARQWRVPRSDLAVVAGHTNRRKILHLAGDPEQLTTSLADWLATVRK